MRSQLGLALACALLVLARWPTEGSVDLGGVHSQQVLRVFGYGLLAAILLLVPAFPATTLVREKMKGTLALLLNSPMTPWSIYIGKLGGVLGFTLILLVMTAPAAAACHALGGGTTAQGGIAALYGVLFIAAVQLSTLALLVSCLARSTDSALRTTYALVLVVCVLTLAPYELLRGQTDVLAQLASWLRCLSPMPAVMQLLGQGDVGSRGFLTRESVIGRYLLLASIASVGCAAATLTRLNHKLFDRARTAGVMTQDRSTLARLLRRLFFLVDPQRRSGSMSLWINPVMVKEFRSRRFGRSHWTLRLIAVCAILSLGLSYIAASGVLGWGVEIIGGALVLLQIALLILFSPSLAAGLVERRARERHLAAAAHDASFPRQDPARQTPERRLAVVAAIVCHAARLYRHDRVSAESGASGAARGDLPGRDECLRGACQCRGQHVLPLDGRGHYRFLPDASGRVRGSAVRLAGPRGSLRPHHRALGSDYQSRGRRLAGRRYARLRPVRAVARQLVDHRLHLRGPARFPPRAYLAAVPPGVKTRQGDKETRRQGETMSRDPMNATTMLPHWIRQCLTLLISFSPCLLVSLSPCLLVSLSPCPCVAPR